MCLVKRAAWFVELLTDSLSLSLSLPTDGEKNTATGINQLTWHVALPLFAFLIYGYAANPPPREVIERVSLSAGTHNLIFILIL